ncbi:MAG: DUF1330 domain-containing protein [Pseudomonadota bacterium]|nr:MAG: DUF1330 domain-containing protein [Pseudomonadota bacterium]
MTALIIVDVRVTNPAKFDEYRKLVPATLEPYGGRFLARGGRVATLEGGWDPKRIVVIEFPSMERARAWWASEEYKVPKQMRMASAETRMIVVESV